MRTGCLCLAFVLLPSVALAVGPTPYAGQQHRQIKALSETEIADYLAGKGMGYAKAAELNRYPGPRHVLDLRDRLQLSEAQLAATRALYETMQAQARYLGAKLVEKERQMDRAFADGTIDPEALKVVVDEIAALQARLRFVHLHAHLEQRRLLNARQIEHYVELRGYGQGDAHMHGH